MSSEVLLQNEVLITLFSQTLLLILLLIAVVGAVTILKRWDFNATSNQQYRLEKRSYLISLIISVVMFFKILLLPYFTYTIDSLSNIVPGAMCAAGVITANAYGNPLLLLKIFILFLMGLWLIINHLDIKAKSYPYTRKKFWFFIMIFMLIVGEYLLEITYFTHISLKKPVACCSVIFGLSGNNTIPFHLDTMMLVGIFYLMVLLNFLFIWQKKPYALALSNLLFLFVSYYAIIHFFGPYIYELPTHICPFCMLQSHYYYSGYLLWGLLFLTVFFCIANAILKAIIQVERIYYYTYSAFFLLFLATIMTLDVAIYRLNHGVWLF